jgi:regulator of sigma E protease
MNSILAFIVVLGILIFFHEFGHFLIARLFGVGVEKFSLGFGPRLLGRKIGMTDYRLSLIPLGGYVKMVGEEPDSDLDPADIPLSFTHKHVFKRILIVAAGPVFNFLLALIIFAATFATAGVFIRQSSVGEVTQDSPAERSGLIKGDRITIINRTAVSNWDEMAEQINMSQGRALNLTVLRDDRPLEMEIVPELRTTTNILGEKIERYVIGITWSGETESRKLSFFGAIKQSFVQAYQVVELMVVILSKVITGDISTDTIGGPIMIAQMAGDQAEAGVGNLIWFIAIISINLAIINLLPIPVLDGGHLLFFLIEAVKGSPVSIKVREVAQQIGLLILILLMILVVYNDVTRLFSS